MYFPPSVCYAIIKLIKACQRHNLPMSQISFIYIIRPFRFSDFACEQHSTREVFFYENKFINNRQAHPKSLIFLLMMLPLLPFDTTLAVRIGREACPTEPVNDMTVTGNIVLWLLRSFEANWR